MSFVPVPCRSKQNEMIKFLLFAITIRNSFGTEKTFEITYPSTPPSGYDWMDWEFFYVSYLPLESIMLKLLKEVEILAIS